MKRFVSALVLAALAGAPAMAQTGKLSLNNATGATIASIHVSPIDVDRFGPNLLSGPLAAGGDVAFSNLPTGLYDMKIVDEKGAECLLKDVDYFMYSIWTITPNCGAFGGVR